MTCQYVQLAFFYKKHDVSIRKRAFFYKKHDESIRGFIKKIAIGVFWGCTNPPKEWRTRRIQEKEEAAIKEAVRNNADEEKRKKAIAAIPRMKLTSDQKYIADAMGVPMPFLPFHRSAAHVRSAGSDFLARSMVTRTEEEDTPIWVPWMTISTPKLFGYLNQCIWVAVVCLGCRVYHRTWA